MNAPSSSSKNGAAVEAAPATPASSSSASAKDATTAASSPPSSSSPLGKDAQRGDEKGEESDPSKPKADANGIFVASNASEAAGVKYGSRRPDVDLRTQIREQTERSLLSKMRVRPSRAELEQRGVLDANTRRVAPSLASAAMSLDRARRADLLTRKMRLRPERHHHVLRTIVEDAVLFEPVPFGTSDRDEVRKAKLQAILNKKIQNRPDRKELQNSNILRGDSDEAPTLSEVLDERRGKLGRFIENRPNRADLVDRLILPKADVAPNLQKARQELQKAQDRDSLSRLISARPPRSELESRGILENGRVAPKLAAAAYDLRKARSVDLLHQRLRAVKASDSQISSLGISELYPHPRAPRPTKAAAAAAPPEEGESPDGRPPLTRTPSANATPPPGLLAKIEEEGSSTDESKADAIKSTENLTNAAAAPQS